MTIQEAFEFITNSEGRIFSVEFVKRSNGELRLMNCRTGVSKGIKGIGSYDPSKHHLIRVYDMVRGEYRTIPLEGITRIKVKGEWQNVGQEKKDTLEDLLRNSVEEVTTKQF